MYSKWKCSEWSECKEGIQKRTCTNINPSCNIEKPKTQKKCTDKNKIKKILFDVKLDALKKRVIYGQDLFVAVSLFNLGVPGQVNVSLTYEITNSLGEIIHTHEEIIPVETQIEFIESFEASEFPLGSYKLLAILEYAEQTEPAQSEINFSIREERSAWFIFWVLLGMAVFLGFIIYILVFWRPNRKHTYYYKDMKEKISLAQGKSRDDRKLVYKELRKNFNDLNEKEKKELLPLMEGLVR